jgi:SNF2 family DNA or RNA helicase
MQTAERRIKAEFGEDSVGTIHGESSPGAVAKLKKRFNDPDDPLRFIIGTKSLESGHNLQGGGTVTFHLDIPDSYASFEQRNARVHRKGQDRDTNTYVLSGTNPFDMRGEDILETKQKEQSILGNPREVEAMDDTGFIGILNKYERASV